MIVSSGFSEQYSESFFPLTAVVEGEQYIGLHNTYLCPLVDDCWYNFELFTRCLTIGATHRQTEKVETATKTATETGTEIETETETETEGEDTGTEDHQLTLPAVKEIEGDEDTDRMAALFAPEGNLLYARIEKSPSSQMAKCQAFDINNYKDLAVL